MATVDIDVALAYAEKIAEQDDEITALRGQVAALTRKTDTYRNAWHFAVACIRDHVEREACEVPS